MIIHVRESGGVGDFRWIDNDKDDAKDRCLIQAVPLLKYGFDVRITNNRGTVVWEKKGVPVDPKDRIGTRERLLRFWNS